MDPLTALLGMSLITGLFGGVGSGVSSAEARKQRKFASREAEKQRSWMEQMSNTAHQREVADLRSAGLNPILSSGGSGASVSGGASASAPSVPDTSQKILDSGLALGNFILSAARLENENKVSAAQSQLAEMQSQKTASEKALTDLKSDEQQMRNNLLPEMLAAELDAKSEEALTARYNREFNDRRFNFDKEKYQNDYSIQQENLSLAKNRLSHDRNRLRKEGQWRDADRSMEAQRLDWQKKFGVDQLNVIQRGQNMGAGSSLLNSVMSSASHFLPLSSAGRR